MLNLPLTCSLYKEHGMAGLGVMCRDEDGKLLVTLIKKIHHTTPELMRLWRWDIWHTDCKTTWIRSNLGRERFHKCGQRGEKRTRMSLLFTLCMRTLEKIAYFSIHLTFFMLDGYVIRTVAHVLTLARSRGPPALADIAMDSCPTIIWPF